MEIRPPEVHCRLGERDDGTSPASSRQSHHRQRRSGTAGCRRPLVCVFHRVPARFQRSGVMDLGLVGKRALVTGSSSGIGAGIAKALASEGVSVVVHGRNAGRVDALVDEIGYGGGKAASAVGDLATDDGAAVVAEGAVAAFGGIDILVNN